MSHTLQEIWEQDGRALPEGDDYPTVEKIAVTHLNMPPELRGFFGPPNRARVRRRSKG